MQKLTVIALLGFALTFGCKQKKAPEELVTAPPIDTLTQEQLDYLMGRFDHMKHPDFVPVKQPYADKPFMFLRKETFEAFKQMHEAAAQEGLTLKVISSTRNFIQQKAIWESKWAKNKGPHPEPVDRARKILQFSTMPGTSRHHWGTEVDLNDLYDNSSFMPGGVNHRLYLWLQEHAGEYGFCQPYTPIDSLRPYGCEEERWHWSYMPLSGPLLEQYRTHITDEDLSGFKGVETAPEIGIVEHYVLGINKECR